MNENLRIFGFKNPIRTKATPVIIILVSDSKEFVSVWPAGDVVPMATVTEEEVKKEAFIPHDGHEEWQEGQIAYLDWNGKVHVGSWRELFAVIETDIKLVTSDIHRVSLENMLKDNPRDT